MRKRPPSASSAWDSSVHSYSTSNPYPLLYGGGNKPDRPPCRSGCDEIERIEQAQSILCGLGIYVAERVLLHKEWNFKRFIIRARSHTSLPGVVTPASIGKLSGIQATITTFHRQGCGSFEVPFYRHGRAIEHDSIMRENLSVGSKNHGLALISVAILEYPGHCHCASQNYPCSAGKLARRPKRCRKRPCI